MGRRLFRGDPLVLQCGPYTAVIVPAAGGRVASLAWGDGPDALALLVEWTGTDFDEHQWPKAGAFPMLPFANRLPPDGFLFEGVRHRPQPGPAGFALHGVAHRRPWQVDEASGRHARLRQVHEAGEEGWPWPWTAQQDILLDAQGLQVTLRLRNDGDRPMPAGLGWHPYHPWAAAGASAPLHIGASARHALDAHGRAALDASAPVFGAQPDETAVFSAWDRRIRMPATGGRIIVACGEGAAALVMHRPASGDYVCAEPVTALPGRLGEAGNELRAGEVRTLTWRCGCEAQSQAG